MQTIRAWWQQRRKEKLMRQIRRDPAFLSFDLSYLTDQEMQDGLVRIGQEMAKCGITAEAFGTNCDQLFTCLREQT